MIYINVESDFSASTLKLPYESLQCREKLVKSVALSIKTYIGTQKTKLETNCLIIEI